jgi:hypothetical protein
MPIFEDEDIPKMDKLMDEKTKKEFLAKRQRLEEQRQKEIDAMWESWKDFDLDLPEKEE